MVVACGLIELPGLLAGFNRDHPAVEIALSEANSDRLVSSLIAGQLDLAIIGLGITTPAGVGIPVVPPRSAADTRSTDRSLCIQPRCPAPPFSTEAINVVDNVRSDLTALQKTNPVLGQSRIFLGGVTPVLNDVRSNTNRDLTIMALVVIAGLFLVLLFVLGSVLIPIRAILTILLSVSWTLALTIVLFQFWRGFEIIFILPLALFVMAMGLGMDYDIFIITRVREEVAKGKPDSEAIAEAMTRTGGIISACGIVMAGAFATLLLNPSPFLQEIGFALAFAILLDSMVVRIYLVPAIMVLAGRGNWWAPGPLQRVHLEDKKRKPEPDEVEDLDD